MEIILVECEDVADLLKLEQGHISELITPIGAIYYVSWLLPDCYMAAFVCREQKLDAQFLRLNDGGSWEALKEFKPGAVPLVHIKSFPLLECRVIEEVTQIGLE